jgi:hypothetical protein
MTIKRRTKILLTSVIVLLAVAIVIGLNPEYERVLEYGDHRIPYGQYLRGERFLYAGHYVTNDSPNRPGLYETSEQTVGRLYSRQRLSNGRRNFKNNERPQSEILDSES